MAKKDERGQLHLRFREGSDLLKRLEDAAALSGRRTATAEVLYRLEQSFIAEGSLHTDTRIKALEARVAVLECGQERTTDA